MHQITAEAIIFLKIHTDKMHHSLSLILLFKMLQPSIKEQNYCCGLCMATCKT